MRVIADLHVHSPYSRATSNALTLEGLAEAARWKGIGIIATADFTHPKWMARIKNELKEDGSGFLKGYGMNFILSVEVCSIFEVKGKKKKVHIVVLMPSIEEASHFADALAPADLEADGRPTLNISPSELVDKAIASSKRAMIMPAHIWTPWYSLFGSVFGVDSLNDAFDKPEYITAFETGLSSDPPMNWMLSWIDKFSLVSNSDAHSQEKVGREANVFDLPELTYDALHSAIKTKKGFIKTFEFFPEEGKYHLDGHRVCNLRLTPDETKKLKGICPICKRKLTRGVLSRVYELGDRPYGFKPPSSVPFQHIIPLKELLLNIGFQKKDATDLYFSISSYFNGELNVYEAKDEEIRLAVPPKVADAIIKVKNQKVKWYAGYDGVFGTFKLEDENTLKRWFNEQK